MVMEVFSLRKSKRATPSPKLILSTTLSSAKSSKVLYTVAKPISGALSLLLNRHLQH